MGGTRSEGIGRDVERGEMRRGRECGEIRVVRGRGSGKGRGGWKG